MIGMEVKGTSTVLVENAVVEIANTRFKNNRWNHGRAGRYTDDQRAGDRGVGVPGAPALNSAK